jgi:hypothetical protein
MKYALEIGLDAMVYIPSFIKDWFRHSVVDKGEFTESIAIS